MKISPFLISSAAAITLSCVISAAAYFYTSRKKEINDVMVFCKLQFNPWNSFDQLLKYIESAKTSVNVCMPSIHNPAIQGRLITLIQKRNIKVRIIIDRNGWTDSNNFLLQELIDAGAQIKCRVEEPYNTQHKFCLVDDEVLLTGTFNWGDDRSCNDWNYVYITNKPQLVEPVKRKFHQMWSTDVDLEEVLKMKKVYESDEDTAEIQKDQEDDENNDDKTSEFQLVLRESQLTPEICIGSKDF